MARYTKDQLSYIALALAEEGYKGLANTIYWWRSSRFDTAVKAFSTSDNPVYAVMRKPKKEMPLYISHPDETVRVIAYARLSYKRSKP